MPSTGGASKPLLTRPGPQWPDSWSPDGRFLIFDNACHRRLRAICGCCRFGGERARSLRPASTSVARCSRRTVSGSRSRAISPAARRSTSLRFRDRDNPCRSRTTAGSNRSGRRAVGELFYRNGDSLMSTNIQLKPFRAAVPRSCSTSRLPVTDADHYYASYDVAKDGRFMAIRTRSTVRSRGNSRHPQLDRRFASGCRAMSDSRPTG